MHKSVMCLIGWLGALCLLLSPSLVEANDCAATYRKKKYKKAALCFLHSAKKMGVTSTLKSAARLKKGGLLRSAAVSLMKAAKSTKQSNESDYLKERALYILRSYDRDKLCASQSNCDAAKRQSQKLYGQIGYARLALAFPFAPVVVQVEGYQYSRNKILKRSPWKLRLRPGTYKISLFGMGQKKQIATITLARSSKRQWRYKPPVAQRPVVSRPPVFRRPVVRRRPAPIRPTIRHPAARRTLVRVMPPARRAALRQTSVLPTPRKMARRQQAPPAPTAPMPSSAPGTPGAAVALYVTGGVLLAAGAGLGIYAGVQYNNAVTYYKDTGVSLEQAETAQGAHSWAYPSSVIVLSIGGGTLLVGAILHVLLQKKSPPKQANALSRPTHTLINIGSHP